MFSAPLPQRIASDPSSYSMIRSSTLMMRSEGMRKVDPHGERDAVEVSTTLNRWKLHPSLSWSRMKSIDQTQLVANGTASGSGFCL